MKACQLYGHESTRERMLVGYANCSVSKVMGSGFVGFGMDMFNSNVGRPCDLLKFFEDPEADGHIDFGYNDGCMFVFGGKESMRHV